MLLDSLDFPLGANEGPVDPTTGQWLPCLPHVLDGGSWASRLQDVWRQVWPSWGLGDMSEEPTGWSGAGGGNTGSHRPAECGWAGPRPSVP